MAHDHRLGSLALDGARGFAEFGLDHQPVAVLRHRVAHERELRLLAFALAVELGLGVGGRGMRLVAALLAVEIPLAVAAGDGGSFEPSLAWKLFIEAHAAICVPSTEKCSSDSRPRTCSVVQKLGQKLARNLRFQQPVAVLREHGRHPHRLIDAEPGPPAIRASLVGRTAESNSLALVSCDLLAPSR